MPMARAAAWPRIRTPVGVGLVEQLELPRVLRPGRRRRARTRAVGPTPRPSSGRARTRRRRRRSRTRPGARPCRWRRRPGRCPSSSSASAVRVGVSSPLELRWLRVREVLKPMAPASTACAGQRRHRLDVVGRGHLALGAALPHHVEPQRAVRHVGGEVDVVVAAVERVEELGERLPRPRQPLVERGAGDVLHALHELDQPVVVGRAHGREADAAVARPRRW